MDSGKKTWMFVNGTSAEGKLGRFTEERQGTMYVQTDSEEATGNSSTILRGCSRFDKLAELYLKIHVQENTIPTFAVTVQTTFTVTVGEELLYKLPKLIDAEDNDEPDIFIDEIPSREYPPFLDYDNSTMVLIFKPEDQYETSTFNFRIAVKELNS